MNTIDPRVQDIMHQQSSMETSRSTFDAHCKEVAERILPRQNNFMQEDQTEGAKRSEKIFDSTAPLALDRAASAIDSLITPATQTWHGLEPEDPALNDDHEVRLYLDEVVKILFRLRYRPIANFAAQAHECYVSLMAFGNLAMFIDDILGIGLRYKSCALSELYFAENHAGIVDLVHRKFRYSARSAVQKWGDKLPDSIKKTADKEPFRKFEFIHCVKPNEDRKSRARDYRGMPISSYYVSLEGQVLLAEGGYRTMPYAISRHVTAPRETYGRSPAMMVLPDIKMVNEMEKTMLRAAHKIVDPPLLLYGDGILSAFNARPNALNYGGVDEQGRQLVHPMKTGSNLPIALDMTEQKRKVINDAFYVTLFQILVQNPQMTATEALIRAQEKGQLLAPTVGRQQSEFLGPVIDRELDIASMANLLPPMPEKLRRAGGALKAIYTSPLSRLRRAEDGVAIMRTLEAVKPMADARPEIWDIFDDDALVRELSEINGVPAKVIRPEDVVMVMRETRRKAEEEAQQLANVKETAVTAEKFAKAADIAQPATQAAA